jgi:precorrin-2 dehydrogenase / sirohydrochlorin ferrochelatase
MHKPFPMISLLVENKRCLIIGGLEEAQKRAEELHAAGALLQLIGRRASEELLTFAKEHQIDVQVREVQTSDVAGVFFIVNTSRDPILAQRIFDATRQQRCILATLDDPARSDIGFAAVAKSGLLRVGVSTGGASPALARRLREELEKLLVSPKTERLLLWMEHHRALWQQREKSFAIRAKALRELLEGLSIEGKLRYPTKFLEEDGDHT